MKVDLEEWNNGFSNPKMVMAQEYRYLVHGVGNQARRTIQKTFLLESTRKEGLELDNNQDIDLLRNPEKISDKKIISTSIIDQDHRATYGDVGFILRAPAGNVLKISAKDNGTFFADPESAIKRMKSETSINSLDLLMQRTGKFSDHDWNEVCLEGKTDHGQVEIIGCFIKTNRHGAPSDSVMAAQIQVLAYRHNWQIVKIEGFRHEYKPSAPDIHDHGAGYNANGCRYWIDFKRQEFNYINEDQKKFPMTQKEALEAIEEILKNGDQQAIPKIFSALNAMRGKIKNLPVSRSVEPEFLETKSETLGFFKDFDFSIS